MKCQVLNEVRAKMPTCSACLEAGLTHLILQLLVLRGDGLPDGDETPHCHAHCLTHPVDGCQGALGLLRLVFMVDQRGDLQDQKKKSCDSSEKKHGPSEGVLDIDAPKAQHHPQNAIKCER